MATFSDLIQRTIRRLSMTPGTGVQIYAEDIIAEYMQTAFTSLFEMAWWNQYCFWHTATLTVNGVVAEDLTDPNGQDIDRYEDIQYIYYYHDRNPLPRALERQNTPYIQTRGTRPYTQEPWGEPGKLFRVLPFGDEQTVNIRYRRRPDMFGPTDVINFDNDALVLGAAWEYLEEDGSNPASAEKARILYEKRVQKIMSMRGDQDIPLNDANRSELENWREDSWPAP